MIFTLTSLCDATPSKDLSVIKPITIAACDCKPESVIYDVLQLLPDFQTHRLSSWLTIRSKQALLIVGKLKDALTSVRLQPWHSQ